MLSLPPATKLGQGYVFTGMCDSVQGGGLPQCMLGYHTPGADTPNRSRHPSPPGSRHPPTAEHAGRYGQCVGGTHPTGMQSCLYYYCPQMKLWEGNVFTPVCDSVHGGVSQHAMGWRGLPLGLGGCTAPWADIPLGQTHSLEMTIEVDGTHPAGMHPCCILFYLE